MRLRCLQQWHAGDLLFLSQLGHLAYPLRGMDLKASDTGSTVLTFVFLYKVIPIRNSLYKIFFVF